MDNIYNRLGERHGGFYPEGRLPIAIAGGFLMPIAAALYGWTAQAHVQVYGFLSTVTIMCIAVVFSLAPMMTYITDTFSEFSASAMTAVLVSRCVMAALLPLTLPPLTDKLGYGWAFTILAAIALVLAPIPCLVMRYGPTWRSSSIYTRDK